MSELGFLAHSAGRPQGRCARESTREYRFAGQADTAVRSILLLFVDDLWLVG